MSKVGSIADDINRPVAVLRRPRVPGVPHISVLQQVISFDNRNWASDDVGLWTGISEVPLDQFVNASASQARGRRIEREKRIRWVVGPSVPGQGSLASNKLEGIAIVVVSPLQRVLGQNAVEPDGGPAETPNQHLLPTRVLPIIEAVDSEAKQELEDGRAAESQVSDGHPDSPPSAATSPNPEDDSGLAERAVQELPRDERESRTLESTAQAVNESRVDVGRTQQSAGGSGGASSAPASPENLRFDQYDDLNAFVRRIRRVWLSESLEAPRAEPQVQFGDIPVELQASLGLG